MLMVLVFCFISTILCFTVLFCKCCLSMLGVYVEHRTLVSCNGGKKVLLDVQVTVVMFPFAIFDCFSLGKKLSIWQLAGTDLMG